MKISFYGIINWGDSNPAIDNVAVTASYKVPSELSLHKITPLSINFGGVSAGTAVTATITANSIGTNNIHILGYGISGAPDYTMTVAPMRGDSIVAGNFTTYTVQFSPITAGSRSATFSLFTDGADSGTQFVRLNGIGLAPSVVYGTSALFHRVSRRLGDTSAVQFIPVTSTGTGPLSFNSIYLIGLNPENYSISYRPQNPLPVGATDSIGIRFTPKIEGRPDASVVINTNAFNMPWDTVSLWAIGTLARLVVQPALKASGTGNNVTMSFDSVALGDSVCQSITLTNTGSDTLRILRQLVTSADYDFSFFPLTGPDTMFLPGQTRPLNVCFRPLKGGTRIGSFRIVTNIPNTFESIPRDTSQFNINVTGVGAAFGRLIVRGVFTDSTLLGTTSSPCIMDTVVNTGLVDLTVTSASFTGAFASEYVLTWPGGAPSFTLHPGEYRIAQICFAPVNKGSRPAMLNITGMTVGEPIVVSIPIAGFGLHECTTPSPATLYDTVLVGSNHIQMVSFLNCGDVKAMDTAALSSSTNAALTLTGILALSAIPGASASFAIRFTPTALGLVTGTLNLSGPGVLPGTTAAINGFGTGVKPVGASVSIDVINGNCHNDTVTFVNNGNVNWTPGSLTIGGTNMADFTLVGTGITPSMIAPGATGKVILKFCPKTNGAESATIDFPSSSPGANLVPGSTVPYTVMATGMASSVTQKFAQNGFVLGQSYPNPTTSVADVEVTLPSDAAVRIDLLDAKGNVVRNAFTGRLSSGSHVLAIDAKELPSGAYYYMLTSGDIRLVRQMVLVK
jgi:hypothetical protein